MSVLEDWQAGRLPWPDAAAALGTDLRGLFVAAYRVGVPLRRRLADEDELSRREPRMTTRIWMANPQWHETWRRHLRERLTRLGDKSVEIQVEWFRWGYELDASLGDDEAV